ncbi:hypothetical protein PR202_gb05089 [Eleusine coracana subsp. coracana]|uniref:Glycosyltransferase n=1 Tax=Eleusine coracana subsp. coracana TaxID=191504 RepID=A0AAV5E6B3_ELECO|nr:hypothetical protein QOZ80_1BG0079870 [Eleusine coracana subsp. coracana]GJN17978.1 hypothetical protein PR202_gb05089 [Eleusine coracana subsp. coracana]
MAGGASATTTRRPVVLYPSPGMGHLVSMIELGKTLGLRGLPVTIVVIDPPYNTGATAPFLAGVSAANPCISFHRLPKVDRLPPVASEHQEALTFALARASNPHLHAFLASTRPRVLVLDFFCSIALGAARALGVPAYFFFTSGAQVLAYFLHLPVLHASTKSNFKDMGEDELVEMPGLPPFPATHNILPLMDRRDEAYGEFLRVCGELCLADGVIVNTFRSLERRAVDAVVAGKCAPTPKVYCIGPLIKSGEVATTTGGGKEEEGCLAWLDAQPEGSVVFLCFGSIGRFGAEQIKEVARGLEMVSEQRFLWVVRAPPSADPAKKFERPPEPDLEALLPEGFLARTGSRGLVVKSWAPQRDVLAHKAVGGFVTHCGWNSVLEAVMAGVPMIAWPLYAEQRLNRVFLEAELRLAVAVEGYDKGAGVVSAEEVAEKVRWLMESEGGRELRERTMEAKRRAEDALREGGESEATLAGLVDAWRTT